MYYMCSWCCCDFCDSSPSRVYEEKQRRKTKVERRETSNAISPTPKAQCQNPNAQSQAPKPAQKHKPKSPTLKVERQQHNAKRPTPETQRQSRNSKRLKTEGHFNSQPASLSQTPRRQNACVKLEKHVSRHYEVK